MVGKGSVRHNSRTFHAKNTDPERSHLNITYMEQPMAISIASFSSSSLQMSMA